MSEIVDQLKANGFVIVTVDDVNTMRRNGRHGYAVASNRKGLALPMESDWALTSWHPESDDEATTDIQDDDEGADLAQAIAAVLADIGEPTAA